MVRNHLKRIATPNTWDLPRKNETFIARPYGYIRNGLPVSVIMKDVLALTKTARETQAAINAGAITIDGAKVKDPKVPAVLLSVVSVKNDASYRVLLNERGHLFMKKDAKTIVPLKVVSKTIQSGKKIQLGFHNGRTMITDDATIKVNDTIVIDGKKVTRLAFEKGATVYFIGGSNVGKIGTVEHIDSAITVKIAKDVVQTTKANIVVIGKDKPVIDVQ